MSTDKRHLARAAEAMSYMTFLTYSCRPPIYSSDGSKRENSEIGIFKPLQCFLSFYPKPLSCLQDLQRLLSLDLNNPHGSGDLPHVTIHLSFSFPLISLSLLKSPLSLTLSLTHTHTHTPHTLSSPCSVILALCQLLCGFLSISFLLQGLCMRQSLPLKCFHLLHQANPYSSSR